MAAVGEELMPGADEIEHTGLDYPMRNLLQVKLSDGLFVLTGGDGALEEVVAAVVDYHAPVAIVEGSGSVAAAVTALLEVYPSGVPWSNSGPTWRHCSIPSWRAWPPPRTVVTDRQPCERRQPFERAHPWRPPHASATWAVPAMQRGGGPSSPSRATVESVPWSDAPSPAASIGSGEQAVPVDCSRR